MIYHGLAVALVFNQTKKHGQVLALTFKSNQPATAKPWLNLRASPRLRLKLRRGKF